MHQIRSFFVNVRLRPEADTKIPTLAVRHYQLE